MHPPAPRKRRLMIVLALAGMAGYLALALAVDARDLHAALLRIGGGGVAAVLCLSLVNYALRFARWNGYLDRLGYAVPLGRHLAYYLGGFAFTVSPGKFGEAVR